MAKERKVRIDLFKRLIRKGKASKSTLPSAAQVNMKSSPVANPQFSANASLQDPEQPIDSLVKSFSNMTLAKFTKFPELPLELRQLIFLYSLSDETRVLPVEITLKEADEEIGLYFTFAISPLQRPLPPDADQFDIALLSACKESRQIYIENNRNVLPAGFKSVIRYNPEKTMVLIQNFEDLQDDEQFAEGIRNGWRKQKWFSEIKQLAVPIWVLVDYVEATSLIWGDNGYGTMMAVFENLDSLVGVISPGALIGGREEAQRRHMEIVARVVQGALRNYKLESNPTYKIPVVGVFEVIGGPNFDE